jgi:hypothetical protein
MSDITIGRYTADAGPWSGWIEGTDNTGTRWITFLDTCGRPAQYWARRDPNGAVVGTPIDLAA